MAKIPITPSSHRCKYIPIYPKPRQGPIPYFLDEIEKKLAAKPGSLAKKLTQYKNDLNLKDDALEIILAYLQDHPEIIKALEPEIVPPKQVGFMDWIKTKIRFSRMKGFIRQSDLAELIATLPLSEKLKQNILSLQKTELFSTTKKIYVPYIRKEETRKASVSISAKQQFGFIRKPMGFALNEIDLVAYDISLTDFNALQDDAWVIGEVVPKPNNNTPSLFSIDIVNQANIENYIMDPEKFDAVSKVLVNEGFDIMAVGGVSITIKAKKSTFLNSLIFQAWKPEDKKAVPQSGWEYYSPIHYTHFLNPDPPVDLGYYYLKAPDDIREKVNADESIHNGFDGHNANIVMIDSGLFSPSASIQFGLHGQEVVLPLHPWFDKRGFNAHAELGPDLGNLIFYPPPPLPPELLERNPWNDEIGHGTMVCANIFCVAPKAKVTLIKWDSNNPICYLNYAMTKNPDIISISWGRDKLTTLNNYNKLVAATVAYIIKQNIVMVFPSGNYKIDANRGAYSFPAQHPDVIAAGGVYQRIAFHSQPSLVASDYASGFVSKLPGYISSNIYSPIKGRIVPDICGLVGMKPFGVYLALPTQPGSDNDKTMSNQFFGNDKTEPDDGWVVSSGTSVATAQVAGVCALIKNAWEYVSDLLEEPIQSLTPDDYKAILQFSAIDVTTGSSANQMSADTGPDIATGYGLVDADKAVSLAITTLIYCYKHHLSPAEFLRSHRGSL